MNTGIIYKIIGRNITESCQINQLKLICFRFQYYILLIRSKIKTFIRHFLSNREVRRFCPKLYRYMES